MHKFGQLNIWHPGNVQYISENPNKTYPLKINENNEIIY